MPDAELAVKIGRTLSAVKARRNVLGIKPNNFVRDANCEFLHVRKFF
jgi:hypothetical protein